MDFLSKRIGVRITPKSNIYIHMKNLFKILLVGLIVGGCTKEGFSQVPERELREEVIVETKAIFKVWYNEVYEQPMRLVYTSTNRPKNVDRGSMDFHTEPSVHTSDKHDYYVNPWDKGHLYNCQHIPILNQIFIQHSHI